MARKARAKRITRRDAVVMMGAGTMMAAVGRVPAGAQPPYHPSCDVPSAVDQYTSGTGTDTRTVLASFSCCDETLNAVLVGVDETGRKSTTRGKKHLAPLQDKLRAAKLEEYCFMIWGLKEAQVKEMFASLPLKMGFVKIAPTAK